MPLNTNCMKHSTARLYVSFSTIFVRQCIYCLRWMEQRKWWKFLIGPFEVSSSVVCGKAKSSSGPFSNFLNFAPNWITIQPFSQKTVPLTIHEDESPHPTIIINGVLIKMNTARSVDERVGEKGWLYQHAEQKSQPQNRQFQSSYKAAEQYTYCTIKCYIQPVGNRPWPDTTQQTKP